MSDGERWRTMETCLFWLHLAPSCLRSAVEESSACSHESALWLRLPRGGALQFALTFVFFVLFSSEGSMCGNRSGGLWEEAAKKRIPLRMYKRSGALCISPDYEIPLASEESRTSEEAVRLEKNETEIGTRRCCCTCSDLN